MRWLYYFVCSLLIAESAHSLCLQNFNVYGTAYAPRVSQRAHEVGQKLKKNPCDILFFQEAWTERSYAPLINSLKHQYPFVSQQHERYRVGLLQLSQKPILQESIFRFRINNEKTLLEQIRKLTNVHKAFLVQQVKIDDDLLMILNVHLHHGSPAIRLTQILDLLSWRLKHPEQDWVLAGDFNAHPDSLEIEFLKQVLKVRDMGSEFFLGKYPDDFCTYCADNPIGWLGQDRIFDYFFVGESHRKSYQWIPLHFEKNLDVLGRRVLSDHAGIRTHLQKEFTQGAYQSNRQKIIQVLERAERLLGEERSRDFREYHEFVRRLKGQVLSGSGPFFDYFDPK